MLKNETHEKLFGKKNTTELNRKKLYIFSVLFAKLSFFRTILFKNYFLKNVL